MNSVKPVADRKGVLQQSNVGFSYTVGINGLLKVGDDRTDESDDAKIIAHGNNSGA